MAFLGGCECVCWTLSPVVYVRMVRCIDKTLIQYVSAGPYNTRSGPQELPRPFRRNSAQAMRLFHKVHQFHAMHVHKTLEVQDRSAERSALAQHYTATVDRNDVRLSSVMASSVRTNLLRKSPETVRRGYWCSWAWGLALSRHVLHSRCAPRM